jgi:hypothetical protein
VYAGTAALRGNPTQAWTVINGADIAWDSKLSLETPGRIEGKETMSTATQIPRFNWAVVETDDKTGETVRVHALAGPGNKKAAQFVYDRLVREKNLRVRLFQQTACSP